MLDDLVLNTGRGQRFFLFPEMPRMTLVSTQPAIQWAVCWSIWCVTCITRLHLASRLIMSGAIPRLLLCACMLWTGSTLHFSCFYSGAITLMPPTIRYVDSGPESLMPHVDSKRNTVHHPQVVYDMPKSTQVYVAPHHHLGDNEVSTPRSSTSDNYRKDFAHGARPGHSLASSDSELSQPATRRVSRHQHHGRYDVHMFEMW